MGRKSLARLYGMTMTINLPDVPASIRAGSYYKLVQTTKKLDPRLAKASQRVLLDPETTIQLADFDGWDLRKPEVLDLLPVETRRLLLYGKVDLALLRRFPNLERLGLAGTIQNWDALRDLPKLRVLDADHVRLPDFHTLNATQLEVLNLSNSHFESLAGLEQMSSLRQLDLHIKVKHADHWQALAALQNLERVNLYTYSSVSVPNLAPFTALRYLCVQAPDIQFEPKSFLAAPSLQALGLDGAPFLFMASPQGVRPDMQKQWLATVNDLLHSGLLQPSPSLQRVYFGDLPGPLRQSIAERLQVPCTRESEHLLKKHYVPIYDDKLAARAEKQLEAADKAIRKRVRAAIGKQCKVEYAAYDLDSVGALADNLDTVCFEGKCLVEADHPDHDTPFRSDTLANPTWLDIAKVANSMILATNPDTDHRFLEGVHVRREEGDVTILGLDMGS